MEDFGDTVPNADVCFFFLKEPPTKQQTVRSDEGRMPERQGHKPGEVSKIHCCLCPSGLGAWAQVESSHLAPGGHGPLSPPPVVTLAELVIFFPASGHTGVCPFLAGSRATVVLLLV